MACVLVPFVMTTEEVLRVESVEEGCEPPPPPPADVPEQITRCLVFLCRSLALTQRPRNRSRIYASDPIADVSCSSPASAADRQTGMLTRMSGAHRANCVFRIRLEVRIILNVAVLMHVCATNLPPS